MSSIHYSQPPKNPNQPRLWLLLNQFLSYVFRNTRLCCLPALGKGKAKIRKSSLREDETNWSSLFSPEHHWLQHTGKRRQGIRTDGSRATLLMSKCFCIGCLDCSSLLVTGFVDPQQCATTPRLQAAGATTLHPCPSQGGRLAQWPWCCLLVRTCPMAMAWLELSERELGISQLCVGLFQQKLCSVKPFDHVSLARFSQRKWWNFCKKHFSVGVHSAPTNFSSKVCSKKRGRIQSYLC